MEQWKPIDGYEGIYEVSYTGQIRTTEGKTTYTELHGHRIWKQRVLKQKTDRDGYKRVTLYKDGKPKDFLVHRLVAQAFCKKPKGKNIVNHIDCNQSNNHASNVEWCSYRENLMHAFKHKLNKSPKAIALIDSETGQRYEFYSRAEASRFLGHGDAFVANRVAKGRLEADGYTFELLP